MQLTVYVHAEDVDSPDFTTRSWGNIADIEPCYWRGLFEADEIARFIDAEIPVGATRKVTFATNGWTWVPHVEWFRRDAAGTFPAEPPARKRCTRCGVRKTANAQTFYLRGDTSDGLSPWCRECHRAYQRAHRQRAKFGRRFGVEIEFICGEGGGQYCSYCEEDHSPCYPEDEYGGGSMLAGETIADAITHAGVPCSYEGYTHAVMDTWKLVTDSSVDGGYELVSPPMHKGRFDEIETVCRVLRDLGCDVDSSTGLHVHHEVSDLTPEEFGRMYRGWAEAQHHTDALTSPSRRDGQWSMHLDLDYEGARIFRAASKRELESAVGYCDRYRSLNVTCYPTYGTVEVRQHQGTLNAQKIIAWIQYTAALIEAGGKGHSFPSYAPFEEFVDSLPNVEPTCKDYLKRRVEEIV